MNTLSKFIASIAALIASIALLWLAFSVDRMIVGPGHRIGIDLAHHEGWR